MKYVFVTGCLEICIYIKVFQNIIRISYAVNKYVSLFYNKFTVLRLANNLINFHILTTAFINII